MPEGGSWELPGGHPDPPRDTRARRKWVSGSSAARVVLRYRAALASASRERGGCCPPIFSRVVCLERTNFLKTRLSARETSMRFVHSIQTADRLAKRSRSLFLSDSDSLGFVRFSGQSSLANEFGRFVRIPYGIQILIRARSIYPRAST